ncbi:MAG: putative sigma-54 modulation protein [Paraglaciecola sp.]|jgi:putative sigma-54 modulation protein
MQIHIQSRQFSLSNALREYVNSKVRIMLGRYETQIVRIDVSLFDINGPRGGEDKCCKIIVKANGMTSIVVEETAVDMYDAINLCSRRTRRVVKRQLRIPFRMRRKFNDILLLVNKDSDLQDNLT